MRLLPLVFSLALFGSAFLSFSIQPILGKMLLPMVGGAPSGWIVAMAFFQLALLAGYGVSWALERFNPWAHAAVLLALYGMGLFFLPPELPALASTAQGVDLSLVVVRALFQTIFLPYLALTATTAALQRVFAATTHPTASDPYYLFVASNVGSFIGLFAYPFVLEPVSGLQQQSFLWLCVYGAVIALILLSLVAAWRMRLTLPVRAARTSRTPITREQILMWLVLSFIPCSLSMGVTTLITTDLAAVPLFWVIPLGLYILTFVLAFARRQFFSLHKLESIHLAGAMFFLLLLSFGMGYQPGGNFAVFLLTVITLLVIFFFVALHCHSRLASLRPPADRLALYYFIVALGGGLAGILHGFILPFILPLVIEFPVMILLSLMLHPEFRFQPVTPRMRKLQPLFIVCFIIAVGVDAALNWLRLYRLYPNMQSVAMIVIFLSVLIVAVRPRWLVVLGLCFLVTHSLQRYPGQVLDTHRNFFGAQAIYDTHTDGVTARYYNHGNTLHGMTVRNGTDEEKYNSSYYARNNPIETVLQVAQAQDIGVIGLGAGQMACYKRGISVDFYEIDDYVRQAAEKYFPYLNDCPVRNIYIGDGRLMVEQAKKRYDVLMVDAFTSDGIPLHLITREAFQVYRRRVRPDGIVLFHVSNRYFNLAPALAAIAKAEGLEARWTMHRPPREKRYALASKWVAIPLSQESLTALDDAQWKTIVPATYLWTDDHSSLLSAFVLDPTK